MGASHARIINTTIREYIRKEEVNILRRRRLLAMMEKKGRITFNHKGERMDWKVRFKRAPLGYFADADTQSFPGRDKRKTASLDWRGYTATDSMTKFQRLQNRGTEAIIKLYTNITKELLEDIRDHFCEELYVDGNAAGNLKRIHGLNSAMGNSGSGTYILTNSDTYAGLSTTLGSYGGSWTGTWPDGSGDSHYDFWSPLLVETDNSSWSSGASSSWANNCDEQISWAAIHTQRNGTMMDMVLADMTMYFQFLELIRGKERLSFTRNDKSSPLVQLGFRDVVNLDGVDVTWEYGVPASTAFGITVDEMELRSMQGQLFGTEEEDYDIEGKTTRFGVDFFGNMRFNPRHFCKFSAS